MTEQEKQKQCKLERIVHVLDWCATAHASQRMPASVFGDIVCAYMLEASPVGLWPMVCAALMARGHEMFGDMLKREVRYVA
jgi:hypothetical protein